MPHKSREQRFWRKVVRRAGADGCWPWSGFINDQGYGIFCDNKQKFRAHRVAWEMAHGPVPEGLFVCHHCDSRSCTNPRHLFVGTNADNMADMVAKGRWQPNRPRAVVDSRPAVRGIGSRVKLTEADVDAIRAAYAAGGVRQIELARQYGVVHSVIHNVITGKTFKGRGGPPHGEQHRAARLTEVIVRDCMARLAAGERNIDIQRALGIGQSVVSEIRHGKTWKHSTRPTEIASD